MRWWLPTVLLLVLVLLTASSASAAELCGGTTTLDRELRVDPGEELTVCPGTSIRGEGSIRVLGSLVVNGNATDPARIGVPLVVDGGNASLVWTHLRGTGAAALQVDGGEVALSSVTFQGGSRGLETVGNASRIVAQDVVLQDVSGTGIHAAAPGHVTLEDVTLQDGGRGLHVTPQAGTVTLEGARVLNVSTPVLVEGAGSTWPHVILQGVEVVGGVPEGVQVVGDGTRTLEASPVLELLGTQVRGSTVGLRLEGSGYSVLSRGSTYEGNGVGVRTEGAWFTSEGDTYMNTRWDVEVEGPSERVRLVNATLSPRVHVVGEDPAADGEGSVLSAPASRDALLLAAGFLGGVVLLAATAGREAVRRDVVLPILEVLGPEEHRDPTLRERVLRVVGNHPGAPEGSVAVLAGLDPRGAAVHLAALERAGKVVRTREAGTRRFLPAPSSGEEDEEDAGSPPDPVEELAGMERRVFDTIREEPGLGQSDVARRVGTSRQAVHYHIKKLADRGLVRRQREGRRTRCFPVER